MHDVNFLDHIEFERDAIYIMDRGYLHFKRLYDIHQQKAFFIVRSKKSLSFKRTYSHPVDKTTGLKCDQTIILNHFYSYKDYPEQLRRVKYYDQETNTTYVYLTNNFDIPAQTIADLYRHRWQIVPTQSGSNGSNNISKFKSFGATHSMPLKPKFVSPSPLFFSLPLQKNN